MTDTPITDEVIVKMARVPRPIGDAILREHARLLERSNVTLIAEVERLREQLSSFLEHQR